MQKQFVTALFAMIPIIMVAQTNIVDSTIHAKKFHYSQDLDESITIVKTDIHKYPESAIRDSVEGQIYVDAIVDTAGVVKEISIHQGVREDLNNSALEAVRKYKFKPATIKGKPTEFNVTNCVRFRLRPPMSSIKYNAPVDSLNH